MATSDAIVVGEDWISEHYFATDGKQSFQRHVSDRRKAWDAEHGDGHGTARSRFLAFRSTYLSTLARLSDAHTGNVRARDDLRDLHAQLLSVLGYDSPALHIERIGPAAFVRAAGLEGAPPLVLIEAVPGDDQELLVRGDRDHPAQSERTLLEPYPVDEKTEIFSVARLLSHLFVSDDAPDFALVLAGGTALVAERERWAEGRYLAVNLQLVAERAEDKRGGETDRALTCIEARSLAPDAEGNQWWQGVLEESVRHTVGVSKDLREGVRLSVEIIANAVVDRRAALGLDPLPQSQAQPLARQSLRFLYRILFLLYAEASPELGVLPVGDPTYQRGYSLDRLRELTLVDIAGPKARSGTHLYESLTTLFRLVDRGHQHTPESEDGGADPTEGLTFRALRADLFKPEATHLIDEVGLGNEALQRVLRHLLLSKEAKGKDRGFISYAELGINQLGAVYEGLMSYTGFFAEEDLHEVAKDGDGEKGSWVVPVTRSHTIAAKDFVTTTDETTGEEKPVLHARGAFVFRLAGRERQQSASYYTPEVLTRFTVGQALEELLDQEVDGVPTRTSAREILDLTICEPALGSGAFAIEAVRQLATEYLTRRQEELGTRIEPDDYPGELQKVKAYLALHNVYGVDLNATAVELAEITLWLDTMNEDLQAPWFGLRLRRGNSLIGARRATFRPDQLTKKAWLKAVPADRPLRDPETGEPAPVDGGIHHFLLPAEGWGAAVDAKEAKELAPEALQALKDWRKTVLVNPSKKQVQRLAVLAGRVERLWAFAVQRLHMAASMTRRTVEVWGADDLPTGDPGSREKVEAYLGDASTAYSRLRRVMDAWCALWFWPLTDTLTTVEQRDDSGAEVPTTIDPPTLEEWISGLEALLGTATDATFGGTRHRWTGGDQTLTDATDWDALGESEKVEMSFAGARPVDQVLSDHPWLTVCDRIAEQQGFLHWELTFADTFATRGGFDLQVGNPPWVRPRSDVNALLAEGDPWWQLKAKSTQAEDRQHREIALAQPGVHALTVEGTADVAVTAAFVGSAALYPHLVGLQPDLYRCFMAQTWRHTSHSGSVGLIHPESHFTDEKAGHLRAATYRRLRRHWQFINELVLFEVHHLVSYGVHVYGHERDPLFLQATSLYHPDTAVRSFAHQGNGEEPGLKDADGNWDLRPHRNRIMTVDQDTLRTWHAVLENNKVPIAHARMVYAVNRATAAVLDKLATAPRIGDLHLKFSAGWHEKNDRTKGFFDAEWGAPGSWDDVILQGPHLHVATPMYKQPNPTMLHNLDWSATDLEALPPDAIPATSYKRRGDDYEYDVAYTDWGTEEKPLPARDFYRVAWRAMAANTGERTLTPALIPPGAGHVNGIFSVGSVDAAETSVDVAANASSLVADFLIRAVPKSGIYQDAFYRVPFVSHPVLTGELRLRILRLNAVSAAYIDLWRTSYDASFGADSWTGGLEHGQRRPLADVGPEWAASTPLRIAADRRQALVEIDALVALSLGITADELCTIYRTQFPVLYGYDRNTYFYDANGRLVPNSVLTVWRKKGKNEGAYSREELTATHPGSWIDYTYELPFVTLDREHDMRVAYAEFERRLAEREGAPT